MDYSSDSDEELTGKGKSKNAGYVRRMLVENKFELNKMKRTPSKYLIDKYSKKITWIEFVKHYANENNITYKKALKKARKPWKDLKNSK